MKRKKLTRREKIELSKQGICWKCGGKLKIDKQRKRSFYICYKCEDEKEKKMMERRLKWFD